MSFEAFYKRFPRRVKPFNARKAYDKAITLASHEAIMEGLERFIQAEPWDEIKFCPHPASWLNAGSWMDEYLVDKARPTEFWERQQESERILNMKVVK